VLPTEVLLRQWGFHVEMVNRVKCILARVMNLVLFKLVQINWLMCHFLLKNNTSHHLKFVTSSFC
jgi:hypothetical protein